MRACVCLIWLSIKLTCNCIYVYMVLKFGVKCNVVTGSGAENVCLLWVVFVLDLFYSLSAYKMDDLYQWFCCLSFLSITVMSCHGQRGELSVTAHFYPSRLCGQKRQILDWAGMKWPVCSLTFSSWSEVHVRMQTGGFNMKALTCMRSAVIPVPEVKWPSCRRSGDPLAGGQDCKCRISPVWTVQPDCKCRISPVWTAQCTKRSTFFSRRFLTVQSWFCPYHSAKEHF